MDQIKIGKFIAKLRKNKNMTQEQLGEQLGVSFKTISKWENGRGMPDVSLFENICNTLGISVNELLKGEYIPKENVEEISSENIIEYSQYLKKKEKSKIIKLTLFIVCIISLFSILFLLCFNKTFFKTQYNSEYLNNVSITIPKYTYYRGTGGMETYIVKLKTLRQPDEVNVFIKQYLSSFEKIESDGKIYYYNAKNDFTIFQYNINNDGIGFVNTIYIGYCNGKGIIE